MPRLARLDAPGVLHHIMIRGIERRNIFRIKKDREDFLKRLSTLLPETQTCCYAWVLMSNHAHILLRTGNVPISTVMGRLLTGYVVSFNRRHKRRGHLFQNRYKSIVCQEDIYLKELVRYIHLNPVRAGIVMNLTQLNTYAYSGHSAIMGEAGRSWQDINYVLGFFGKRVKDARRKYLSYMKAGYDQGHREEFSGGGLIRSLGGWSEVKKGSLKDGHVKSDERILGESDFVSEVLSQANEKFERKYELKRRGYDIAKVAVKVSKIYKIDTEDILSKGKQQKKVKARSLFCYWAAKELGIPLTELSRIIGISVPAIGYSVERGSIIAIENNYKLLENGT